MDARTLGQDVLALLKTETGIEDETQLIDHVLKIQKEALVVYDYPCIRRAGFLRLKISKNAFAYEHVLQLVREHPDTIILDIGCCFGNDLRKIARDGFPARNMVASDLRPEYWELGHKLFHSTPESFPATFISGDALDDAFLKLGPPLNAPPTDSSPELCSLSSLNDLRGHVSAIHTASFFHLFSENKQLELARKLAGLLSPRPGSIIFGCHAALPSKGFSMASKGRSMFCHSPDSWSAMWEHDVFGQGTVEARAGLKLVGRILNDETDFYMMFWSVKKL
ncbi:hypothetical protein C8F01DRAFT_1090538 [Mycena amicta]|nr:hypothetical protein C8F01DRAFT_1090538 [Mycena amicta]